MEIEILVLISTMLAAGAIAGLLAGLLGIGGGIVIVPVLYQALSVINIDDAIRMKVAVGSSLATIIITSYISSKAHARKQAVDWKLFRHWIPAISIGVLVSVVVIGYVNGEFLTAVFAIVALIVALYLFLYQPNSNIQRDFPNKAVKHGYGFLIGSISTLIGIGGASLSVPILRFYGYSMRNAVGTGAALGIIIAIPATIGFIFQGWNNNSLPPFSLGYVNLLAVIIIIPMTVLMAPIGAKIAHKINEQYLQRIFACFLLLTSARMFYSVFTG